MRRPLRRCLAASGLMLVAAAACRSVPVAATPAETISVAAPAATPTPIATPWILVDEAMPAGVKDAISAWAASAYVGLQVRPLDAPEPGPPAGLWAVVGEEQDLLSLHENWAGTSVAFIVLEPSSLSADSRTSTLGPELRYDQVGFLAGVAAGLATQTGEVGVMPGDGRDASGAFRSGFEEGLLYSCPKCRLETVPDPGQVAFGIDVIGIPPGTDLSAVEPGTADPWLVVFGEPFMGGWAERVAARVRVAPEAILGAALERLWEGEPGEAWPFDAEGGGLVTEVNPQAISPGRERLLREAEASLAEGLLVVGGGT